MIGALNPSAIIAAQLAQGPQQPAQQPFQWGHGGRRMTPEDIARERQIATRQMDVDYSPVQHWTQGLARVAENLIGGYRSHEADKAAQANADYGQQIIQSLLNPGGVPSASGAPGAPPPGANIAQLSAIMADPYVPDSARAVAQMQLEQQQKMALKQFERNSQMWEDNAGNRWRLGANGMPEIVFHDKNAKRIPQKVFDADGNEYIEYVEVPNAYGPDGQPVASQTAAPIEDLPAGYTVRGAPPVSAAPPPPDEAAMARARAEADAWMKLNGMGR